jgi:hypothetical protein
MPFFAGSGRIPRRYLERVDLGGPQPPPVRNVGAVGVQAGLGIRQPVDGRVVVVDVVHRRVVGVQLPGVRFLGISVSA